MARVKTKMKRKAPTECSVYPSVKALADDIGMCERSTREAIKRGQIPAIRCGKRIILPRLAIAEWLRTAGQDGTAA